MSHYDDDQMDDESSTGEGTADTDAVVYCPFCSAPNEIALDPGSGHTQEYVEDCQVCCRAWMVHVRYRRDGSAEINIETADGG